MSNYTATVVEINNIRPHENADKLVCTNIFGNNVIVGLDTKIGDTGLFFPLESQIGLEFAQANDLIRRKDENGKSAGGMFDQNRRVRAQTFRGEKSMGFFIPIDSLANLLPDVDLPAVMEELEVWKGFDISKKYVIPARQQSSSKQGKKIKKESRVIPEQFHYHFDTAQLGRNLDKIYPNSLISITWKTHGTSGICGNILVKKKLKWYEKLAKIMGLNIIDSEYDYIYSSRRVIKNDDKEYNHFYNEDIWSRAGELFKGKLHKGETIYFEILGYLSDGAFIQRGYDYGCQPGEFKIQIYRITQTNVDGIVTELPWHQVRYRAKEIGFETVYEIYYGYVFDLLGNTWFNPETTGLEFLDLLRRNFVHDQDCQFCKNIVASEGVVVRVENGDGIENYKLKNFRFFEHETKELDKGAKNIEEQEEE